MAAKTTTTKPRSGPTDKIEAIDKHVGYRIRQARTNRGWTREMLAKQLAVSMQQIQKWEEAGNRLFMNHLWGLSQVLDYPISWFFEGFAFGKKVEDWADASEAGPDPLLLTRENMDLLGVYHDLPSDRKRIVRLVTVELGRATEAEKQLAAHEAAAGNDDKPGHAEAPGSASTQA